VPMPKMMPSMVSIERTLLRHSARNASLRCDYRHDAALTGSCCLSSTISPSRSVITRSRTPRYPVRGDQHDRDAGIGEALQRRHHLVRGLAIEVAGRLVAMMIGARTRAHARSRRAVADHPRADSNGDARDRGGSRARAPSSRGDDVPFPRCLGNQGHLDVLERTRARQQVEALKHEPDHPAAHVGELRARQPGDVLASSL